MVPAAAAGTAAVPMDAAVEREAVAKSVAATKVAQATVEEVLMEG